MTELNTHLQTIFKVICDSNVEINKNEIKDWFRKFTSNMLYGDGTFSTRDKNNAQFDSQTRIFFETCVNNIGDYVDIFNFSKHISNIIETANYIIIITQKYQKYSEEKKDGYTNFKPTKEIVCQHINNKILNIKNIFYYDLKNLIIEDQKGTANHKNIIRRIFLIFDFLNILSQFSKDYQVCCSWYSEWIESILLESNIIALKTVKEKITLINENVAYYGFYSAETNQSITRYIRIPLFTKIFKNINKILDDNGIEEIKLINDIFPDASERFGPFIVDYIVNSCISHEIVDIIELNKKYTNLLSPIKDNLCLKAFRQIIEKYKDFNEDLAIYINSLFTMKIDEDKFEELMYETNNLADYIFDKDVFQKYITLHFGKRILYKFNIDKERIFLTILKQKFGTSFVHFLEIMFRDILSAKDLVMHDNICVTVLTQGVWPSMSRIKIPKELENQVEKFSSIYKTNYPNRRLNFISAGTAEVRYGRYILNCSTLQMCILLSLNQPKTSREISEECEISQQNVDRCLSSLNKIIKKNGDKYEADPNFKSKTIVVKVPNIVIQKQTIKENSETTQQIQQQRDILLESTIVRIMKARKTLEYNNIVIETTNTLKHRFNVTPSMIKKSIESLIEKEYIQRQKTNIFNYLA